MTEQEATKMNGWTFEETVKTAEKLMESEKNMFKWDVLRHLRDFAENFCEEIQQYRAIGTPDECRAAMEKQKEKKIVRVKLRQSEWGSEYRCPACESDLIKTEFFNEDGTEHDKKISWCSGCGQKLYWSDGNE